MRYVRLVVLGFLASLLLLACSDSTPVGFSLSVSPAEIAIAQGDRYALSVTVNRSGGFAGPVVISLAGAAEGIITAPLTIPAGETSGVLDIRADVDAPLVTHAVTVLGTSGNLSQAATLTIRVVRDEAGFSLSVPPEEITIAQGDRSAVTVTANRTGGFAGPIVVTLAGAAEGIIPAPLTIPAGETSGVLDIYAYGDAQPTTHNVTVLGTSGTLSHAAALTVRVVSGFSLYVLPAAISVVRGSQTATTVAVNRRSGTFDEAVSITVVGEPEGMPEGVSASSFIIPAGEISGQLTIYAASNAPLETRTVTVRGTGGDMEDSIQVTITVVEEEPDDADVYILHGLVVLTETTLVDNHLDLDGSGFFGWAAADEGLPADFNPFAERVGSCSVDPETLTFRYPFDLPVDSRLNAGEQLTVYAGGNPYARFIPNDEGFQPPYLLDPLEPPATPLPDSGLSIEIPGDEFPALYAPLPESPALILTSLQEPGNITLDTTFSWLRGLEESVVVLAGIGDTGPGQSFICIAHDSGSFSFPAEAREELTAAGFTTGRLTAAGRFSYSNHTEESALLTLVVARSLDLEFEDEEPPEDDF